MDIEAVLHSFKDGRFRCIMIPSINGADGVRPAFLRSLDGGPKDAFSSASSVAEGMEEADYPVPIFRCLPTIYSRSTRVTFHFHPVWVFGFYGNAFSLMVFLLFILGLGEDGSSACPCSSYEMPPSCRTGEFKEPLAKVQGGN